jgi:hypothetical protein
MAKQKAQIPIPQAAAACTAFAAFSVSILVGLSSDNPATTVLSRALVAMVAGFAGGFAIGLVCDWLVREEISRVESEFENRAAAESSSEVDLGGLTGVDIIEEPASALDSARVESDDRPGAIVR